MYNDIYNDQELFDLDVKATSYWANLGDDIKLVVRERDERGRKEEGERERRRREEREGEGKRWKTGEGKLRRFGIKKGRD